MKKEPPSVIGDGVSTLRELIEKHEGIVFRRDEMLLKHTSKLTEVLAPGIRYYLSQASNRVQGGKLIGIDEEIDQSLQDFFDGLSHYSGKFFYGRYDIKCQSIESLREGKHFSILEFNGAGAGTQHIYANNYSLFKAMKIILQHWKMMFAISRYNQQQGEKKWDLAEGWRHLKAAKKNLMMLKRLDASFPSF